MSATKHVTGNSLARISEQKQPEGHFPVAPACGAARSGAGTPESNIVIIIPVTDDPDLQRDCSMARIADVSCPVCRVLIDCALERADVVAMVAALKGATS